MPKCNQCGVEFEGRADARFCSTKCRVSHLRGTIPLATEKQLERSSKTAAVKAEQSVEDNPELPKIEVGLSEEQKHENFRKSVGEIHDYIRFKMFQLPEDEREKFWKEVQKFRSPNQGGIIRV